MEQDLYKQKYFKYKEKYLELKKKFGGGDLKILIRDSTRDQITNYITPDMYDSKRVPSFCDRLLYKGDIQVTNYGTILAAKLCESDHLMVFGQFQHNSLNGLMITFNIDILDKKQENSEFLKKTFEQIMIEVPTVILDYVVICLQESASTDIIPNIFSSIITDINNNALPELNNKFKTGIEWTYSHSTSSSRTDQNSRMVIIHNKLIIPTELKTLYYGSMLQYLAGSKSAVGFNFDDICFVGCHLPIDTTKKKQDSEYMGNNLRISALEKIVKTLEPYKNCIIGGDLNFRIYEQNGIKVEQLNKLMQQDKPAYLSLYKEFGELKTESCKINSVSSCKLVV